jgi:hypothetical protein
MRALVIVDVYLDILRGRKAQAQTSSINCRYHSTNKSSREVSTSMDEALDVMEDNKLRKKSGCSYS